LQYSFFNTDVHDDIDFLSQNWHEQDVVYGFLSNWTAIELQSEHLCFGDDAYPPYHNDEMFIHCEHTSESHQNSFHDADNKKIRGTWSRGTPPNNGDAEQTRLELLLITASHHNPISNYRRDYDEAMSF
jgi:hypothetical protein